MTWYYVDIENTGPACLRFFEQVDPKQSKFIMYYTTTTPNLSWYFWVSICGYQNKGFRIEYKKAPPRKESADKHILVDVACSAAKCPTRDYVIISDDKGFQSPVERICEMTHANVQVHSPSKQFVPDSDEPEDPGELSHGI